MGLRVWGTKHAANAQKVMWCLGELGIAYEHVEGEAAPQSPLDRTYLALQGHVVPMIDDDGFVLWEGNAIARYLAERYGRAPFWPDTPAARASAGRWMDFQLSTLRAHLHLLMRGTPDPAQIARASADFGKAMQVAERALERHDYLVGDHFTVGDIPLGIMAFRWSVLEMERPAMPAIEAWFARLKARPAYRAHVTSLLPQNSFTRVRAPTA